MQITFELKNNANQKVYESKFDKLLGETECGGYGGAGSDTFEGVVDTTVYILNRYKTEIKHDVLQIALKGKFRKDEVNYLQKSLSKLLKNK